METNLLNSHPAGLQQKGNRLVHISIKSPDLFYPPYKINAITKYIDYK